VDKVIVKNNNKRAQGKRHGEGPKNEGCQVSFAGPHDPIMDPILWLGKPLTFLFLAAKKNVRERKTAGWFGPNPKSSPPGQVGPLGPGPEVQASGLGEA
jgi:hypothetical protein